MLFEVRGHLHSTITKALAAMDRDLNETGKWKRAGELKYMLGKRYLREGQFAEAYAAFVQAEPWLADEKGIDHQHVVAAIIRQAQCLARLPDPSKACEEYARALRRINETGHADHPAAKAISDWISASCPDPRDAEAR